MIKYLLLFILPFSLYASKILSYNIYDRSDRVDVMITFDTPYHGVIKQSIGNSTITIKLQDASIESAKMKQLSSKYIKSLSITPMSGYTKIIALVPPSVNLRASKTSDAYGLRLRFATKAVPQKLNKTSKQASSPSLSLLPTKKSDDIQQSYYIVIAILIVGIGLLFFIKKRVAPAKFQNKQTSWLFKETQDSPKETTAQTTQSSDVSIRFQKSINQENSVVMLDFGEQSYLVIMGKSNILLDKFTDDKPITQDDFDTILQDRHRELDDFLHKDEESLKKEPLQAYKERAASIAYEA
jgi:hypothetical protein